MKIKSRTTYNGAGRKPSKPDTVIANVLLEWVETNNLKVGDKVQLEVVEKNKYFKLSKMGT